MKKIPLFVVLTSICLGASAQENKKPSTEAMLKNLSEKACSCIDSINIYDKSNAEVAKEINKCINKQVAPYQLASKLVEASELTAKTENEKDKKKKISINVNNNVNSEEFKKYYYELERELMSNCNSLKEKIASNEKQSQKSFSSNAKATEYYSKGLEATKNKDYAKAVEYFEKAVKEDPEFAFAWDNLGVNYRRLDNYDKAIEAYNKSLSVDPYGLMPLQNIAVAYQYKKEYQKAIEAYQRLAQLDEKNPEVYYGIGNVYAMCMNENEKGLEHICKAYLLYIEQKSPYRSDAEKLIGYIYSEMKKEGKEKQFQKILKAYNISTN